MCKKENLAQNYQKNNAKMKNLKLNAKYSSKRRPNLQFVSTAEVVCLVGYGSKYKG